MSFNSYIFVFLLLPVSLIGYFTLNYFRKYKFAYVFLLIVSLCFYAYCGLNYLLILLTSLVINYCLFTILVKKKSKPVLIFGLIVNVGSLLYFKYLSFFITTINELFNSNIAFSNPILPLAISFYTFSQISILVDVYKQETNKVNFIEYALYITYFPKMIQGPIMNCFNFNKQLYDLEKKRINFDNLAKGIYSFCFGMAKKILIANVFGKVADFGYANIHDLDTLNSLIVVISYYVQIYFDFSAYSDMVNGISLMFNFELPENFNSPYKACNIAEYWKRWHMSLTSFLTKYIYIPLGGNRKGKIRTYVNTLIVFTISGLWHGANWTYVLWGLINGIAMVVYKNYKKYFDKLPKLIGWLITTIFVIFSWIFFRANSITDALMMVRNIFEFNFLEVYSSIYNCFWLEEVSVIEDLIFGRTFIGPKIYMLIYFLLVFVLMYFAKNNGQYRKEFKPNIIISLLCAGLLVWSILYFSGITTFIYENF